MPAFGWFRWVNIVGLALVALLYLVILALLFRCGSAGRASLALRRRPLAAGACAAGRRGMCLSGCRLPSRHLTLPICPVPRSPATLHRVGATYNRPLRLGVGLLLGLIFCILGEPAVAVAWRTRPAPGLRWV